jgi:hypothetical protein
LKVEEEEEEEGEEGDMEVAAGTAVVVVGEAGLNLGPPLDSALSFVIIFPDQTEDIFLP